MRRFFYWPIFTKSLWVNRGRILFNKTNLSKRKLSKPLLENLFKAAIKFLVQNIFLVLQITMFIKATKQII